MQQAWKVRTKNRRDRRVCGTVRYMQGVTWQGCARCARCVRVCGRVPRVHTHTHTHTCICLWAHLRMCPCESSSMTPKPQRLRCQATALRWDACCVHNAQRASAPVTTGLFAPAPCVAQAQRAARRGGTPPATPTTHTLSHTLDTYARSRTAGRQRARWTTACLKREGCQGAPGRGGARQGTRGPRSRGRRCQEQQAAPGTCEGTYIM
jgi:hypothetical protein